jgi:glycosyltransferase involved in cell wall biosynthesis
MMPGHRTARTVLFVDNSSRNLTNFRKPIVRAIQERGFEVVAAVPNDSETQTLDAMGIRAEAVCMDARGTSPIADARLLAEYGKVIRRVAPEAVLAFTAKPNIYGSIAASRQGIPVINTITGLGTGFLSGSALQMLMSWLYRIALRRSRKVFFHNSDDRDQFVGAKLVRVEQTAVLPGSGIDLNRFKPGETIRSDGLPTFLFIGRLLRDKGAVEFAEAAKIVRAQFKARFQILGPTDDHPKAVSRDRMKAWEAEGLIELLGAAPDVRPFIRNADCVVLPSYREGFPRVLLEASAMAKPVIASDVPGCSHAVDHRVTGLLCQARSAQSLAAAMIGFLNTPATDRIAMGSAGRAKAEREFSEDIVSDAYIRALDELALSAGDRLQGAPC